MKWVILIIQVLLFGSCAPHKKFQCPDDESLHVCYKMIKIECPTFVVKSVNFKRHIITYKCEKE